MGESRNNVKGALLGLLAMAIYAAHDAVVKVLGGTFSAFQIVFFAALLSFPMLTVIMLNDKKPGVLRPIYPAWVVLRSACIVAAGVCAFYAFSVLPLAQVYPILFAMPLLVTVLSIPLLGETVRIHRWAAVVIGLIGVMIVVRPGHAPLTLGHLAAFSAAFCSALASVIVRKIGSEERSVVLLIYPMVASFIAMGLALPFVYKPMEIGDVGLMGLVGLFGLIASYVTILAYREGEAVIVAPMQYSQILWAVFYGYVLFNERVDGPTVVGASIVIASGIYIVMRESGGSSANRPVTETRLRAELATSPRVSLLQRMLARSPR